MYLHVDPITSHCITFLAVSCYMHQFTHLHNYSCIQRHTANSNHPMNPMLGGKMDNGHRLVLSQKFQNLGACCSKSMLLQRFKGTLPRLEDANMCKNIFQSSQRWSKQFCKANDFSLSQLVGTSTSWLFTRINNTPPRVNSLLKSRPFLDLGIQIASPNFKYLALFGIELQGYAILFPNYPNSNIIIIIILVKPMEKSSLL